MLKRITKKLSGVAEILSGGFVEKLRPAVLIVEAHDKLKEPLMVEARRELASMVRPKLEQGSGADLQLLPSHLEVIHQLLKLWSGIRDIR